MQGEVPHSNGREPEADPSLTGLKNRMTVGAPTAAGK